LPLNENQLNRANTLKPGNHDPRASHDTHLNIPSNDYARNPRAQVIATENDDDDDLEKRASQLKSAYNIKSQDKREPLRVKSLQLLCFKLANHKKKIMMMLEKYVTH
jgi:hypothetical protein